MSIEKIGSSLPKKPNIQSHQQLGEVINSYREGATRIIGKALGTQSQRIQTLGEILEGRKEKAKKHFGL